jgi:hypothetical protein
MSMENVDFLKTRSVLEINPLHEHTTISLFLIFLNYLYELIESFGHRNTFSPAISEKISSPVQITHFWVKKKLFRTGSSEK